MDTKKERGRPTKYKPEFIHLAGKHTELGADDNDLAKLFQVDRDTIYEWKKVYPEFSDSIQAAKDKYDNDEIEKALARRARGFMRVKQVFDPEGNIVMLQEEIPPDTTACSLWLRNRQPERWRDKQEHEHTGKDGAPLMAVLNVGKKPEQS